MIPEIATPQRLRLAREAAGLTAKQVAEQIGVARSTVINYEKGHTEPKRHAVIAWSTITDVPVWWIEGHSAPVSPDENSTVTIRFAPSRAAVVDIRSKRRAINSYGTHREADAA